MARSLTVQQEERAATSPLFTGFLILAVAWMLLGAFQSGAEPTAPLDPATTQRR